MFFSFQPKRKWQREVFRERLKNKWESIYFWFGRCSRVKFFFFFVKGGGAQSKQTKHPCRLPQGELKVKSCCESKQSNRWHVCDVDTNKKAAASSQQTDGSYHSAPRGEEVWWSAPRLPVTFADTLLCAGESLDVDLSSVAPFVSSFHICCISAGLKPPETWNKTSKYETQCRHSIPPQSSRAQV